MTEFKKGDRVKNHVNRVGSIVCTHKDQTWVAFDNDPDVPQTFHYSNLTELGFEIGKTYKLKTPTVKSTFEVVHLTDRIAVFLATAEYGGQYASYEQLSGFGNYMEVK